MSTDDQLLSEVDEMKAQLKAMKKILELKDHETKKRQTSGCSPFSMNISNNTMSIVFLMVLFFILFITVYAFSALYFAVLKRFPSKHTEL
ncbi:hypothetical protein M8J76_005987 [Diaphorina citri]|nr:hypothetical protein M8J76_005987 [Diaphorina citri]KAI5742122.1 hypothetical protein M8J77_003520 [Diaphorina citri]